jgi:virginiamycin A acetyltransferase
MLQISPRAKISPLADIEDSVRGTVISISDDVIVDSFVKIKPVGGTGDVFIGDRTKINSGVVIYSGNGVQIGKDVLIAANCTIAPVNHAYRSKHTLITEQGFEPSLGGIIIEDDVWIGANTVILDGARIRRGVVVGAHSLIRGELRAYGVFAGRLVLKDLGDRT